MESCTGNESIDYDTEMRVAEAELYYKEHYSVDGKMEYFNGNIIMHHEAPLEDGLLGFTDAKSFVYVTTANKYGRQKREILNHEHLHILRPDLDEYEIRREVARMDNNSNIDFQMKAMNMKYKSLPGQK